MIFFQLHDWLSRNVRTDGKRWESGFLKYCRDCSKVLTEVKGMNSETGRLRRCEALVQRWYNLSTSERKRYSLLISNM